MAGTVKCNVEVTNGMRHERICAAVLAAFVCAFGASTAAGQLGARSAQEWVDLLDRPERVEGLRIDEVIARLGLEPGDVVADIGAGAGTFSLPFARAVSPDGTVYAVEVDAELVDYIDETADARGFGNVEGVLGEFTDPALPSQDIDVAFFHDVLHHVEDRAGYLRNLGRYMGPNGRIAIIEGAGHNARPDQSEMHMTLEQVHGWMADAGFEPSEEHDLYGGDKWFVVYSRP